jgi:diacylglycerol kinase (ATP)
VRVLLIVNPIAGQARPGSAVPRLRECLRGFASECVVHLTEDRGDARRAASRVAPGRFDAVVAVGGDGTINEVVNGLAVDVPLGITEIASLFYDNVLGGHLAGSTAPRHKPNAPWTRTVARASASNGAAGRSCGDS